MNNNSDFLNGKPNAEEIQAKKEPKKRAPRKPKIKPEDAVIPLSETEEVLETTTDLIVIDTKITQQLEKQNITESALKAMEEEFLPLTIIDALDKDGYSKVAKAETMLRNTRTLAVKLCKLGRAGALAEQRAWIKKESELEERILKTETILKERRKVIDDIKDAEKQAKEVEEQNRIQARAVNLVALGMSYDGESSYFLDDIRISVAQVKQLDDFVFGQLLAGVEVKFKENQEIKAREDELRLAAEANNKRILEETLAKEELLKKKELEIAVREQAIKDAEAKAKLDAENLIIAQEAAAKKAIQDKIDAENKAQEEKIKNRRSNLFSIGFALQGDNFLHLGMNVPVSEVSSKNDTEWNALIANVTAESARIKVVMEQQRIVKEAKDKLEAEEAARTKLLAEQAETARIEAEKADAIKKENERLEGLKPDLDKLNSYCKAVMDVPMPIFTSEDFIRYREKLNEDKIAFLKQAHNKKPK